MKSQDIEKNPWLKLNYCPYCTHKVDAAIYYADLSATPNPGDLTVCAYCTQCSQFDDNLSLVKVDVTELPLEDARTIHKMQVLMARYKKEKEAKNEV